MEKSLNENIRTLRMEKAVNQVELAKALNVSKQCVSNWENDNVVPSIEMLVKLADFFGVSTDYLLGRCASETLDVSGLTAEQISHLRLFILDLTRKNKE